MVKTKHNIENSYPRQCIQRLPKGVREANLVIVRLKKLSYFPCTRKNLVRMCINWIEIIIARPFQFETRFFFSCFSIDRYLTRFNVRLSFFVNLSNTLLCFHCR